MEEIKFETDVWFRTLDFDSNDYITSSAILSLFQDIAGLHAYNLGVGYEALLNKGYYWVLVRNEFEIFKNPKPLTKGKLETWPHKKGRIDFNREYVLYDSYGDIVARGISKWVVINTLNRRLSRTDDIDFGPGEYVKNNFYDDVLKIKIPSLNNFKEKGSHQVSKKDLDHNKHMNNSKYADIIFDLLPEDLHVNKMNIDYIKETRLNDVIKIYEYHDEEYIYYLGKKDEENIFVSRIERNK